MAFVKILEMQPVCLRVHLSNDIRMRKRPAFIARCGKPDKRKFQVNEYICASNKKTRPNRFSKVALPQNFTIVGIKCVKIKTMRNEDIVPCGRQQ